MAQADGVLVITGAGVSAESGLPTYRGVGGLYNSASTEDGVRIEEALSGGMLRRHPEICWKYIAQIESACRGAEFNAAHQILAEMETVLPRFWVLTQNVDGFHTDAGSKNVIEMHGTLRSLSCTSCSYQTQIDGYLNLELPPHCPVCEAIIRPDVVLFGEALPDQAIHRAETEMQRGFGCVLSIGTTSGFPYIAAPVYLASQANIPTIEINPGRTEVSHWVDLRIKAGAVDTLRAIQEQLLTILAANG